MSAYKPTLLDRAIGYVAPQAAASRMAARVRLQAANELAALMPGNSGNGGASANLGGYTSTAGTDTFLGRWQARSRSAAADTLRQLPTQRAQARDLVRNHPIAASAINTNVVRAIGTGLAYSPQPHLQTLGWSPEEGAAWAAEVAAEFSLWADSPDCDWYGEQNFYALQDLVTRARLESGDAFSVLPDARPTATMPYRLRVQVLEADRVGNPANCADSATVAGGVRRAESGGPVTGFYVYDVHPGGLWLAGKGQGAYTGQWVAPLGRSGRRRMLHHFKRLRPEQPRGVPYLAPVVGLFKLLGDYTDAEVKAAVISAYLTLVIETPSGTGTAPIFDGKTAEGGGGSAGPGELEMGPGYVMGLAAGEKANVVNPSRPNPAFGAFVQAVLDQLGAGTFLGSEMLLKKFSTSYTAARAAYLDAWKHLLDVRTQTARDFCQPVLETWMAEAVAVGRVRAPGFFADPRLRWAYTRAAWPGDSQGSLNPKDEVAAMRDAIEQRLVTRERASWELFGEDWRASYPTQLAEHRRLVEDGMAPVPRAGAPAPAPQPAVGGNNPEGAA
jgi:lambda family phage portal protein